MKSVAEDPGAVRLRTRHRTAMPAAAGEPRNVKGVPDNIARRIYANSGIRPAVNAHCWPHTSRNRTGDPQAVSPARSPGLAQFKLETWATYGVEKNGTASVWDTEDALLAQAFYMCIRR